MAIDPAGWMLSLLDKLTSQGMLLRGLKDCVADAARLVIPLGEQVSRRGWRWQLQGCW